jgi:glycosyltransferase involved in cell wall biosynthesis
VSRPGRRPLEVWCDRFPVVSETFIVAEVRELARLGHPVTVFADHPPADPALGVEDVRTVYLQDQTRRERLTALVAVIARRPLACIRDRRDRRRFESVEPTLPLRDLAPAIRRLMRTPDVRVHAHFAAGFALHALRATRIAGRDFSLTAHGYDIYQSPRNLEEKLRAADVVTSGCDYTVADLRGIAGSDHAARVHRIVMGVDPDHFRRSEPHTADRTVLAVGRLVEKKGFVDLIRAAADPSLAGVLGRVVILGEGPLHDALTHEIERLGVADRVELLGRTEHAEVRDWLERAAVLAMPCVVARDGDRDSMPVVVKEALAMEVPVVATDEVGLPELVRPEFGRTVPPGDPAALARALRELLELSPDERARMGRTGRRFVSEFANVETETAKLSALLDPR